LAYIVSNFGNISQSITRLEEQGLSIQVASEIFANLENAMARSTGLQADRVKAKFTNIVNKNTGIEIIAKFCKVCKLTDQFDFQICDVSAFGFSFLAESLCFVASEVILHREING